MSEANLIEGLLHYYPTAGEFAWRGPYLSSLDVDPWGNSYVINASGLSPSSKKAVWVISAGPNGKIETSFYQESSVAILSGDDIAYRIK